MARSAEDYGIPGLDEETLRVLAGNPRRYGEKGRYASQELAQRKGLMGDAETYRAALQRATYQQLSPEFSQGLSRITSGLAGAGPLADSGAATALRARLAGNIYSRAAGQVGGGYASYLGNLLNQRRQYNQQRALMAYQKKLNKKGVLSSIAGAIGGLGGSFLGGYGQGLGGRQKPSSIANLPQGDYPEGYPVG